MLFACLGFASDELSDYNNRTKQVRNVAASPVRRSVRDGGENNKNASN